MDTNEHQAEQSQPQSDSSSGGGTGQKSWKTAAFIAVLVLAGAVAAHSVLTRNGGLCGVLPCGMRSSTCSLDKGNGNGNAGGACAKSAVCASEKACCPLDEGDGNGNGDGGGCAEKPGCPFAGEQGCCASQESCPLKDGQGAPPSCCPMGAPTGCCPAAAPQ